MTIWIKLIIFLAIIAVASGTAWHLRGIEADRDIGVLKQQVQGEIIKQQDLVAKYTQTLQIVANGVEEQTNVDTKKHNAEIAYYKQLVNQSGGLYDNGTSVRKGDSATAGNSGSDNPTSSGTGLPEIVDRPLSEENTAFLLDQANKADRVVDQYLTCQQYVKKLTDFSKLHQGDPK
jgi:hypothetical protein